MGDLKEKDLINPTPYKALNYRDKLILAPMVRVGTLPMRSVNAKVEKKIK